MLNQRKGNNASKEEPIKYIIVLQFYGWEQNLHFTPASHQDIVFLICSHFWSWLQLFYSPIIKTVHVYSRITIKKYK